MRPGPHPLTRAHARPTHARPTRATAATPSGGPCRTVVLKSNKPRNVCITLLPVVAVGLAILFCSGVTVSANGSALQATSVWLPAAVSCTCVMPCSAMKVHLQRAFLGDAGGVSSLQHTHTWIRLGNPHTHTHRRMCILLCRGLPQWPYEQLPHLAKVARPSLSFCLSRCVGGCVHVSGHVQTQKPPDPTRPHQTPVRTVTTHVRGLQCPSTST